MRKISKAIRGLLLIALLVSTNGCLTYSAVQEANGRHDKALWMGKNSSDHDDQSHPEYYFLLPATVPVDVITAPLQLFFWVPYLYLDSMGRNC